MSSCGDYVFFRGRGRENGSGATLFLGLVWLDCSLGSEELEELKLYVGWECVGLKRGGGGGGGGTADGMLLKLCRGLCLGVVLGANCVDTSGWLRE